MLTSFIGGGMLLAARSPGKIVGPIANLLGVIYNVLFNFIYGFIQSGSLGIAIILFTLFVKLILFPLFIKQQKSMYNMQKLQPELNKIKAKYKDKKDQDSQQRMAFEMQEFQKKNGVSMFGGCLPLLIQLPILYALFYIFQQAYLYVDIIGNNYNGIANAIIQIPASLRMEVFGPFAQSFVDINKLADFDMNVASDVIKLVNSLKIDEWNTIIAGLGDSASQLSQLLEAKMQMESFLGIDLVYKAGLTFPGIIIPVLAGGTTWIQSKMMTKNQNVDPSDPTAATMKTMNLIMPLMMGFMTISMPAALGLYWTVSNLFTMLQQWAANKYFKSKDAREAAVQ